MYVRCSQIPQYRVKVLYPYWVEVPIAGPQSSRPVQMRKYEITIWVREHARDGYTHFLSPTGVLTYAFKDETDAFALKMRWV